jgi:hypothetical protein
MELLEDVEPLKFPWNDAFLLVKRRASVYDKFVLDMQGSRESIDGKLVARIDNIELGRVLVKLFVVGWENVTKNGKAVAYSYDVLERQMPADKERDFYLAITDFIVKETDVFKKDVELKNVSRRSSNGSVRDADSTAAAKTASESPAVR